MRYFGIKLTHDAAVACIEDGALRFSVELEKVRNAPRYTPATRLADVLGVLVEEGVTLTPDDVVCIDGWDGGKLKYPSPHDVAPYHEWDTTARGRRIGNLEFVLARGEVADALRPAQVISTTHVAGHILGAYAMSPFSATRTPANVLVMDGGVAPRVWRVDPAANSVRHLGSIANLYGTLYGIMGYYAGPYLRRDINDLDPVVDGPLLGGRDVPGKLMAWIAHGKPNFELMGACYSALAKLPPVEDAYAQDFGLREHQFMRHIMRHAAVEGASGADILATIHAFVGIMLVDGAADFTPAGEPLIFTGGSALNIKWNSDLRRARNGSPFFIPPCPNDSGSAIGAACAARAAVGGAYNLTWSVYSGPQLPVPRVCPPGWLPLPCSPELLGGLLATRPFVVLHGRAEIGPRALGHRSILSAPTEGMKDELNRLKGREAWRPVAPIALWTPPVANMFHAHAPDPHMLYDHRVNRAALDVIPAIVHLDGTARLQTVTAEDCPVTAAILQSYAAATGRPPILCNTSANFHGTGFFPDVESALLWGKLDVWADGTLYTKEKNDDHQFQI